MIYLIFEIVLFLVLAAILGYLVATFINLQLNRRRAYQESHATEQRVKDPLFHLRGLQRENQSLKESNLRLNNQLGESMETLVSETDEVFVASNQAKDAPDNLTDIYGIGPRFEELLHRFGIESYCQLADLSDSQISELATLIGPFGDRIKRDRWVDSASQFCESKTVSS